VIAAIVILAILGTATSYQKCVGKAYHKGADQQFPEGAADLGIAIFFKCPGLFVSINADAVIAAFTIILGLATGFLWLATRDLVREARDTGTKQIAEAKSLATATQTAADAAKNSADTAASQLAAFNKASAGQASDMKASIKAAEDAAIAAKMANDLNRTIFIASERPWVGLKEDVRLPSAITLNKRQGFLNFEIDYVVENTGRSPAKNVKCGITVYPMSPEYYDPLTAQKKIVLGNSNPNLAGDVLFPGKFTPHKRLVAMEMAMVEKAMEGDRALDLLILGTIAYEFMFEKGIHETNFAYHLRKRLPSGNLTAVGYIDDHIPPDDLGVLKADFGNNAN